MNELDIVILSNGPGEISTWVRPFVKSLAAEFSTNGLGVRISVVLSPCPHSTGKEAHIALSYPEIDRVLPASNFFSFLLWGKTKDSWQWHSQGVVIFLGGDQFYTLAIAKRLGYQSLVYAEWEARWYRYLDAYAVMNEKVATKIPEKFQPKLTVVGDLIADIALEVTESETINSNSSVIGLLPGSKSAKLMQGVPFCLAIAQKLQSLQPNLQFLIPVAPTLDLETIASYAQPASNKLLPQCGNVSAELITQNDGQHAYLLTSEGTKIDLITEFPAYQKLLSCQLCVTTVGANTAELGSLGIPMIVILPTQQLDAMRSWDGIPGILANLPVIGSSFAKLINLIVLKQNRLFAWPNIWAKQEIVPELIGKLDPEKIAITVKDYLDHPEKLQLMSDRLIAVRGNSGAAQKIATIVHQLVQKNRS